MDVNQKLLMELAEQLGLGGKANTIEKKAEAIAGQYADKSDEELLKEIMSAKEKLKSDPVQFQKQLSAIKSLRGVMNREQQQRLDRVLALLERK